MSASSSSSSILKRPAQPTKLENLAAKRARIVEDRAATAQQALDHQNQKWIHKATETHKLMTSLPVQRSRETFISFLNKVRNIDNRPALSAIQIAEIPSSSNLLFRGLTNLSTSPLTFDISSLPSIYLKQNASHIPAKTNLAQFYIRRLTFSSHKELMLFAANVMAKKPHYSGHLGVILFLSSKLQEGTRYLHYAGFTVANNPVGRELDDEEAESSSLIKAAVEIYGGTVEVFEIFGLRFALGSGGKDSVLACRDDIRVGLYESLAADTLGCFGLNTAAAGIVLETKLSNTFISLRDKVRAIEAAEAAQEAAQKEDMEIEQALAEMDDMELDEGFISMSK